MGGIESQKTDLSLTHGWFDIEYENLHNPLDHSGKESIPGLSPMCIFI